MTTKEHDDAEQTTRRAREQHHDRNRRLREAIEAERRLGSDRAARRRHIARKSEPRYAYLTHTHD
jgi:hypothetical protein